MPKSNRPLFSHILHAFLCAFKGLHTAWRDELAFRVELLFALFMIPLAFFVGNSPAEKTILAVVCLLVLAIELLNSAIEATIDRIGAEHHPLSAKAKDLGAAAVLIALGIAALAWGHALWLRFIS